MELLKTTFHEKLRLYGCTESVHIYLAHVHRMDEHILGAYIPSKYIFLYLILIRRIYSKNVLIHLVLYVKVNRIKYYRVK